MREASDHPYVDVLSSNRGCCLQVTDQGPQIARVTLKQSLECFWVNTQVLTVEHSVGDSTHVQLADALELDVLSVAQDSVAVASPCPTLAPQAHRVITGHQHRLFGHL